MKKAVLVALCASVIAATVAISSFAQTKGPHEAEFRTFYAAFLKAAQANDKEKLADMIAFPVKDWSIETKGDVQEGSIKDKADFLARYNILFTSSMRLHVQKAKVQPKDDGWFTSWREGNSELAFEFIYIEGTGFRIETFDVGAW